MWNIYHISGVACQRRIQRMVYKILVHSLWN